MSIALSAAPRSVAAPVVAAPVAAAARAGNPAGHESAAGNVVAELQAHLLGHVRLADAAPALARETARRLGYQRVALGVVRSSLVRVVGVSGEAAPAPGSRRESATEAAMAEAIDQRASVAVPERAADGSRASHPRITLAHRRLIEAGAGADAGAGANDLAASVPMFVHGVAVGALSVVRRAASAPAGLSAAELETLEALGRAVGPVLELMRLNERSAAARLVDAGRAWLRPAAGRHHRHAATRPLLAGAALLLVLLLGLVPMPARVGGAARLEGAVQRVLIAPSSGFLKTAHVRAGDSVQAGQVLVELAEEDLLLDRQRWASQLTQFENTFAAANARGDRAQLVINQSRAAEAEAQLALVDMKIERARITAPFDGVVIRGDLSQQLGAPVEEGTELLTVAPRGRFRVMVQIDERDIAAVAVGQSGSLALSALPWDTLALRVARITPMAVPIDANNVFEVEAELLEPPPADLRPGLQGQAHIGIGAQPPLWSALRRLVEAARLFVWDWLG